ncbi:MAG: leucine--tRNA ligase, partial [Sphaerochaetaceae bacterium]|nr:leucine--tRNA ligase [Sphaerochaetaceae bacterium]
EELWEMAGYSQSAAYESWPTYSNELTIDDTVEVVFQINGKLRAKAQVSKGYEQLKELAFTNDRIKELLEGKTIVKTIVVPDKLVNIVIKG